MNNNLPIISNYYELDKEPARKSPNDLVRAFKWKLEFYLGLRRNSYKNFGIKFVFDEILSKNQRRKNYLIWESAPKLFAKEKFGIDYSDSTPSSGLREVYFRNLYTKFPDFIPTGDDVILDAGA